VEDFVLGDDKSTTAPSRKRREIGSRDLSDKVGLLGDDRLDLQHLGEKVTIRMRMNEINGPFE
jgi:hypothetical protein